MTAGAPPGAASDQNRDAVADRGIADVLTGRGYRALTGNRLCQAIVDRLTFEAPIIETGTDSFRLASTTAKRMAAAA